MQKTLVKSKVNAKYYFPNKSNYNPNPSVKSTAK